MTVPILEMKDIGKSFPGVVALDHANLDVRPGEVHLLLGENGAGKSTLIKILSGAYTRDSGSILLEGREADLSTPQAAQEQGIAVIYQEFNLVPWLSAAENIFLGREFSTSWFKPHVNRRKAEMEAWKILKRLSADINPRAAIADLGVAQQQMVEVAKALSMNARIIVMDEPTAALTGKECDTLFSTILDLKSRGVAIIYISHRLEEFHRVGDRATVMRDGKTIKTLDLADVDVEELVRLMVGRSLKDKFPKVPATLGDEALRVENLSRGNKVKNASFSIREGEVAGLYGLVGAGRTELARALFRADAPDSGKVYLSGKEATLNRPRDSIRAGLGFLTEDRKGQGLVMPLGVDENVTLASLDQFSRPGFLSRAKQARSARQFVGRMRIKTPSLSQEVKNLSGGNQQKVVLAKWLSSDAKVFLFDEPTRGIDVGAKIEVYQLMNELTRQGKGILLISSELPEILGMSDRILVMCRGELVADLPASEADQETLLLLAAGGGKTIVQ
ncbi:MAG: sugar ABC transporter ATP-binding protein [Planctomycetota bacterium]|nr:sugar ABC transporter ATP-binding protein [Planctomycetota bacterium]